MIKPLLLSAAALALLAGAASAQQSLERPGSEFSAPDNPGNWLTTISRTARGHLIGNPEAEAQLTEFVSYTCGHCASFTANGEPALELAGIAPGTIALEVRPVIRNALDLTVSLLANCGDPAGFKDRHRTFMLSQGEWLGKVRSAPQTQQAIWARGDKASRMNAASALGLTQMLAARGQSQSQLDACVMDDAAAKALLDNGRADYTELGVSSTPSFALDGKLLGEVHSWEALEPVLSERLTAATDQGLGAPG